jgi:hypothetical protein
MDIARLLLCLSDPMDFLISELKLSFCHAMILHHLRSFWFIHEHCEQYVWVLHFVLLSYR